MLFTFAIVYYMSGHRGRLTQIQATLIEPPLLTVLQVWTTDQDNVRAARR